MSDAHSAPSRSMKLAAFVFAGMYSQSWRHPEVQSDGEADIDYFVDYARTAESALFDMIFMADESAMARDVDETGMLARLSSVTGLDPLTIMTAVAMKTERVGLIFTASTSYNHPYNIARQVASLDHISKGRAGWNLVTSNNPREAENFGLENGPAVHAERYARAAEFHEVVTGLWDSFEDDAILLDKVAGLYSRPGAIQGLDFKGRFFDVKGPLKMHRPPQGWPVIAQAGASEPGRELGARTAEVVFCTNHYIENARAFYADMKARCVAHGRHPSQLNILPGVSIVCAETQAEAEDRYASVAELYPIDIAIQNVTGALGSDISEYDLDGPFPEMPPAIGSQGHQRAIYEFAKRGNLTIRETAQRLAASSKHRTLVGTPESIADDLGEWFETGAADGFVIMSPHRLKGFRDFAEMVVPELQRRGHFRTAYEGTTLRDNLGLTRPDARPGLSAAAAE